MAKAKLLPRTLEFYVKNVRPILIEVAKKRTVTTYSELMERLDGPGRAYIGEVVGEVSIIESREERPLLSAVVVRKDTKMPGEGFWGLTYETQSAKSEVDRRNFWESELNKVYDYWQRHDPQESCSKR